jgi:benzoyl-CoA reductase/2-hydroxyglutaryl-CoA dehydratase subunit BcrC/BadD/HgdB
MTRSDQDHKRKEVCRKKSDACGAGTRALAGELPAAADDDQDHKRKETCKRKVAACDAAPACGGETPGSCGAAAAGRGAAAGDPLGYFQEMLQHCHEYAVEAKQAGRKIVGILCEFTPRELILAAGAVPVCLCGGSARTIPAAEQELPANLCPLIKSTYGYHLQKSNPFLEMADLVVAETTCDGKKKMYELMGRTRPMYVLELPQKAEDADARAHWGAEVRKLKGELERRFGVQITECKLRGAIRLMNRERGLRRRLAELMKADAPALTGRQLITLKSSIAGIEADLGEYEHVINRCDRPTTALADKLPVARGNGNDEARLKPELRTPAEAGTPNEGEATSCIAGNASTPRGSATVRVLLTGVPMAHGAERVLEIIEGHGGLVVAMENCTGLKPILEDVDEAASDPLEAIAEKYFHLPCSVMTPNTRRVELLKRLAREYRAECVIELVWQACLTYDVESGLIRRVVEDELGLSYLKIETDYSPSDSARIATRVEALCETVRGRQP